MMGLGSGAGAAGLAALHGGVASAAEASLLPPRGNIAERAHRSPEQDTAAPGLQADSIPVYRQRRRADSCGNVQPSLERLHLENTAILSAFTALLSNLVSNVPAVLALKPFVAPLADPQRAWLVIAMASTLAGRVLVVDDEPDILDVLTDILGGLCYDISTVVDGAEALVIVRMTPPDVVPLDLATRPESSTGSRCDGARRS